MEELAWVKVLNLFFAGDAADRIGCTQTRISSMLGVMACLPNLYAVKEAVTFTMEPGRRLEYSRGLRGVCESIPEYATRGSSSRMSAFANISTRHSPCTGHPSMVKGSAVQE